MEYRLDVGLWNQVFAVPAALVDRHLKLAGKEQLQVILWLLRHPDRGFAPGELAQALGMPEEAALDCLDYWEDRGLLASAMGELRPVPQPEVPAAAPAQVPVQAPAQTPAEPAPQPEAKPLPPKKRMPRPDVEHLTARLEESEEVFSYIICAICPLAGDYEPGKPVCGFLFPSFSHRSASPDHVAVFQEDPSHPHGELERQILECV